MEAEEFGSGSGDGTEGRKGSWAGWFPSLEAGRLMPKLWELEEGRPLYPRLPGADERRF